jgi:hypothetical protein
VPAEVKPAELAKLIDFAERPRTDDWSLRSALVRYAQPQPALVSDVLDDVRRLDWAVQPHAKLFEREGPQVWQALDTGEEQDGIDPRIIELLRLATELDRLGDIVAGWAADRSLDRPDTDVSAIAAEVARRLDELGVAREDRRPPPSRRRG